MQHVREVSKLSTMTPTAVWKKSINRRCTRYIPLYVDQTAILIGYATKSFFATFDREFQGIGRTVKMCILECHTVEWLSLHQAGCCLMGEQGAESIHAKFNLLNRTYCGIRNPLDKLKSMMEEHYLNVTPRLSAAMPPVEIFTY